MKTTMKEVTGRIFRGERLRDERGMMLVLTMVIFLVIASLAATNLINSHLERSLARNQHYASVAQNAADAGIAVALAWLNTEGDEIPDHTVTPGWIKNNSNPDDGNNGATSIGLNSTADNTAFTIDMRFKREDDEKFDNDQNNEIVLYNSCGPAVDGCYDYDDAVINVANGGDPVIQITATGTYGESAGRTFVVDVASNPLNVQVSGALTSASSVTTTGTINIDGNAHDIDGNPCATCGSCGTANTDDYPGITVDIGKSTNLGGSATTSGSPTDTDNAGTYGAIAESPDEALGLAVDLNSDGDFYDLGEANAGGILDGMMGGLPADGAVKTKMNGNNKMEYRNANYNYTLNVTDTGILIMHNPLFNPDVWRVSVPTVPNPPGAQVINPDLNAGDPRYDATLNADYESTKQPHLQTNGVAGLWRPRNFNLQGNGTYKGVIIADSINSVQGGVTIIGALVSLSGTSFAQVGAGTATVLFSCDAINAFTAQGYSTKLRWQRVY